MTGKKSQAYYTGRVTKTVDGEGDLDIEFLRRSEKAKNKFIDYDNKDETWSVPKHQMLSKLTKCDLAGTKRTKDGHVFNESIVKYAK